MITRKRVRAHLAEPMFRSAYALILNTVLSTGFGLLFWIFAARWYSVEDVGKGQVAINSMLLLSGIGSLRLSGALIRYLPSSGNRAPQLLRMTVIGASVGSVATVAVYSLIAPSQIDSFLWPGLSAIVLLAAATVGWSLFTLQDAIMIGLRRATWVPVQNAAFSALKIVALLLAAALGWQAGIFWSWLVPMVAVLVPVHVLIGRVIAAEHTGLPTEEPGRRMVSFVGVDYFSSLCEIVVVNGIPVFVAVMLGFEDVGVFATTWIIGTTLDHVLVHFGNSLVVEGVRSPAELGRQARTMVRRCYLFLVPLAVVVVLAAPILLSLFGPEYADDGTLLLQLLAVAMLPRVVQQIVVVIARVRHRLGLALVINVTQATAIVIASLALAGPVGVAGPGIAYLAASAITALVLIPVLVSMLREPPPAPFPAAAAVTLYATPSKSTRR